MVGKIVEVALYCIMAITAPCVLLDAGGAGLGGAVRTLTHPAQKRERTRK